MCRFHCFHNSAQVGNISVSPPHTITRTPFCVWVCTEMIRHCYPTAAAHRLPLSILPPVVCHHFHPIITPPPPGSLLWLLSKWDHRRSVNTQVCDRSHSLCSVVCLFVCPLSRAFMCLSCVHTRALLPHVEITFKRRGFSSQKIYVAHVFFFSVRFQGRVHVFSTRKKKNKAVLNPSPFMFTSVCELLWGWGLPGLLIRRGNSRLIRNPEPCMKPPLMSSRNEGWRQARRSSHCISYLCNKSSR